MNRRKFLASATAFTIAGVLGTKAIASEKIKEIIKKVTLSESEWRKKLTPAQFHILREDGTEPARSSNLNSEKREGIFACAGCDLPLFSSKAKYESGTGWPSFYEPINESAIATKRDFKLFLPRTEYHCSRCGGHQGHLFDDGPAPTGIRYCNNGLALNFHPKNS